METQHAQGADRSPVERELPNQTYENQSMVYSREANVYGLAAIEKMVEVDAGIQQKITRHLVMLCILILDWTDA